MKERERLERIAEIGEVLRWLTGNPAKVLIWSKEINKFCEGVHFLAAMPDGFMRANIEQFDVLRKCAADTLKAVSDAEKTFNSNSNQTPAC